MEEIFYTCRLIIVGRYQTIFSLHKYLFQCLHSYQFSNPPLCLLSVTQFLNQIITSKYQCLRKTVPCVEKHTVNITLCVGQQCVISPCGDISRLQVAYFSIFCLLFYCLSSSVLGFFFFFSFYRLTKPTDFEQVGLSFVQKSPTDKTSYPQTHNCQLKTTHRRENLALLEVGGGFSLLIK